MSGTFSHEPPRAGRSVEELEQENAALRARVFELEASERSLRDIQRLALAVLDHSPSVVLVKARDGSYLLVNRGLEAFFGKPQSELLGATDFDVLPPEVAKPLWEQDLEIIRTGEGRQFEDAFERDAGQQTYLTNKFAAREPLAEQLTTIRAPRCKQMTMDRCFIRSMRSVRLSSWGVLGAVWGDRVEGRGFLLQLCSEATTAGGRCGVRGEDTVHACNRSCATTNTHRRR